MSASSCYLGGYMETRLKVRVKSAKEMDEWFKFDEVVNIRYFKQIGKNTYEVLARTADCDLEYKGVTNLQRIKERVVKGSNCYPLKSRVIFEDGTERIFYSSNEHWEKSNAEEFARINCTKVSKIERL